eukprot:331132_1
MSFVLLTMLLSVQKSTEYIASSSYIDNALKTMLDKYPTINTEINTQMLKICHQPTNNRIFHTTLTFLSILSIQSLATNNIIIPPYALISTLAISIKSASAAYTGWITPSPLPHNTGSAAVGYDEQNDTIWIIGGHTGIQIAYKDGSFIDYGWQYLPDRVYGQAQYYTQVGSVLYMIHDDGRSFDIFDLEHVFITYDYKSIRIPNNVGTSACLVFIEQDAGYLMVIGGWTTTTGVLDYVQILNMTTNQWILTAPSLNVPRNSGACIAYHQWTYAIGGATNGATSWGDALNSIEVLLVNDMLNIQNQEWSFIQNLSRPMRGSRSVIYGDDILVIGGEIDILSQLDFAEQVDEINVIDTNTNQVRVDGNLGFKLTAVAPIVVKNILYSFGGVSVSNVISSWRYLEISSPTNFPSRSPSNIPTTNLPTFDPTEDPTLSPTNIPSTSPTNVPSTKHPTFYPTNYPTLLPSKYPTTVPSTDPSTSPSTSPSINPTNNPTASPTETPTLNPSISPSEYPTKTPTILPTTTTISPSNMPTLSPSKYPTISPSTNPTISSSINPSLSPSQHTESPTLSPTNIPSISTISPSTGTTSPSNYPTLSPFINPTITHFIYPTSNTNLPNLSPTKTSTPIPSKYPTIFPSTDPSKSPSKYLSMLPSQHPTSSNNPTISPTKSTAIPTLNPSLQPTNSPIANTVEPTKTPSNHPTTSPIKISTNTPSDISSAIPSSIPSMIPSNNPNKQPISSPTILPTDPIKKTQNPTLKISTTSGTEQPITTTHIEQSEQPLYEVTDQSDNDLNANILIIVAISLILIVILFIIICIICFCMFKFKQNMDRIKYEQQPH